MFGTKVKSISSVNKRIKAATVVINPVVEFVLYAPRPDPDCVPNNNNYNIDVKRNKVSNAMMSANRPFDMVSVIWCKQYGPHKGVLITSVIAVMLR